MTYRLEEAHESGHALLAYLAGADVLGAVADSCEGKGYTRLKPLPSDHDGDRLIVAQALHIMGGLAAQRLCGYGKAHDYRADADREELREWYKAHEFTQLLKVFGSYGSFENFMTCTAEEVLRQYGDAFRAVCSHMKSHGSIDQNVLDSLVTERKWIAPNHDDWWQRFLSSLRGSSEALIEQQQVEAAAKAQQAQNEIYRRRYEDLRSRSPEPERTTFHRPRVESML